MWWTIFCIWSNSFQATKCHHHRRQFIATFFARRLPPVAFSLSPIRFWAQDEWKHLFNIFHIVLSSSSRHFIFGRSFVFFWHLCPINRHHPFTFTPYWCWKIHGLTCNVCMVFVCVQASHHCIAFVNRSMEFHSTHNFHQHTQTHTNTSHAQS